MEEEAWYFSASWGVLEWSESVSGCHVRTHSHTDQNVSVLQAAATLATNMRMDRTKTKSRDLWCEESSFSFFIAGEKMRTR